MICEAIAGSCIEKAFEENSIWAFWYSDSSRFISYYYTQLFQRLRDW